MGHCGGRFSLYEAKWSATPTETDAAQLRICAKRLGPDNVERMGVVCRTEHAFPLAPGIQAVPVSDIH